jgi:hypothetical protein
MPAEKSKKLEEGQKELKRLRALKQELANKLSKKKTGKRKSRKKKSFLGSLGDELQKGLTNKLREELEDKLNIELTDIEGRIKVAETKLRNATNPIDLVNSDVFDRIKDIAEDVVQGKKYEVIERVKDIAEEEIDEIIDRKIKDEVLADTVKDVLDHVMNGDLDGVVDVVKDGAKDKADEVIDKHVKDEKIATILKDVTDEAIDGDLDGVVDVVKDGAKDKVDEVIDKHVKDEKIAAILKDVADGAIDGEWDTLLDIVKDGAIDIVEGKLEEFIQKLIDLFETQIQTKIEFDMNGEAKLLIPKGLEVAKERAKATRNLEWTAKLIKTLTLRLTKETAVVVGAEIKYLASSEGLKVLIGIAKDSLYATLKTGLAGRTIKEILKTLVTEIAQHPAFKKIIDDFKRKLLKVLISVAEEIIEEAIGAVVDAFIRVHNPWLGKLLDTGKRTAKIGPVWGCVNLALSVEAKFEGKIGAKRKGLGGTATVGLSGWVKVGVGISIGFDVPLVGDISIEGGVRGGPVLSADTSLSFRLKNAVVHAKVVPATLDIKMQTELYLETPIPNRILKYVPVYLTGTSVADQTITYPIGSVNVLTATTPGYELTFDLVSKKYAFIRPTGGYTVDASPKVKAYLKDVKDAIGEAAQSVVDAVNPTNWDLNPFDDDGWAGGWF